MITWPDVIKAKQLKELGPPEDVEYIERERHAVAVHEACHAVIAYRTRQHMEIDIATIEKGSNYLGMVSSIKPEDQFTRWRSEYEADILVALASLAGERMFFDSDSSSGVSGDLDSATTTASFMEAYWGMGKTVSSSRASRRLEGGTPGGTRAAAAPVGDRGSMPGIQKLADRIEDNLGALLVKAEALLRENERYVLAVAHALESHKTLSGEDITVVFEGGRGPLVDGDPYSDDAFIDRLREYHSAAARAHREHNQPDVPLPVPTPAYAMGYAGPTCTGPTGTASTGTGASSTAPTGPGTGPGMSQETTPGTETGPATGPAAMTSSSSAVTAAIEATAPEVPGPAGGEPGQRVHACRAGGGATRRRPARALPGRAAGGHRLRSAAARRPRLHRRQRDHHPSAVAGLDHQSDLFRHEARHATQYACCGGLLMLPCYFAAAGVSWLLSGDVGAWNPFERLAGLADGGYRDRPLRWPARNSAA